MIYQIFNLFGQAFSFGWSVIVDLVEASGMTKAVFIGVIITFAVLGTIFGTLRARAFSGGDQVTEADIRRAEKRIRTNEIARDRLRKKG